MNNKNWLNCPFCGCDEIPAIEKDEGYYHGGYKALCSFCGASSAGDNDSYDKALEAWNTRPPVTDNAMYEQGFIDAKQQIMDAVHLTVLKE